LCEGKVLGGGSTPGDAVGIKILIGSFGSRFSTSKSATDSEWQAIDYIGMVDGCRRMSKDEAK